MLVGGPRGEVNSLTLGYSTAKRWKCPTSNFDKCTDTSEAQTLWQGRCLELIIFFCVSNGCTNHRQQWFSHWLSAVFLLAMWPLTALDQHLHLRFAVHTYPSWFPGPAGSRARSKLGFRWSHSLGVRALGGFGVLTCARSRNIDKSTDTSDNSIYSRYVVSYTLLINLCII